MARRQRDHQCTCNRTGQRTDAVFRPAGVFRQKSAVSCVPSTRFNPMRRFLLAWCAHKVWVSEWRNSSSPCLGLVPMAALLPVQTRRGSSTPRPFWINGETAPCHDQRATPLNSPGAQDHACLRRIPMLKYMRVKHGAATRSALPGEWAASPDCVSVHIDIVNPMCRVSVNETRSAT